MLNEAATCYAFKTELARLENRVVPGDTVIIHFSGHGQQILTAASKSEVDRVDEAMVPYDAPKRKSPSYAGENHMTDDIFGSYILAIRNKAGSSGLVIAVIDACHSDSMDKNADGSAGVQEPEEVCRGTEEIFGAETLSPDSIEVLRDCHFLDDNTPVVASDRMADAIFIAACGTHQRNYEIKKNGVSQGSLTYYFCKAVREKGLSDINMFLTTLYSEMSADKTLKFHGQHPNIRTSFAWAAPESAGYVPDYPSEQSEEKADNKWLLIGVVICAGLILIMISAVWKRRK